MDPLRGSEPVIPGYRLVGRLGSGGFGTVYAAEDSSGRSVAIKVLRPELSDDKELLSRLEREAVALRQVTGDHTATILEVNTRGEYAHLVMELIEGQNLEEYVRSKGPLKGFELRVVVEELVAALGEIHRAGVIHRDLKPSNVMYGPAGVTLLDFGISSLADSTALTKSGAFIGTAGWISPEQIEGRPVSAATDVFNLGLVIAYAATGSHPFGTGRPEGIMYRICHHDPEVSGVPEPIQGLVRECLNPHENARVGIAEIARVIEADFGASWEPTEEPVEETATGGIASTRRVGRRSVQPGSTIRAGAGAVSFEAVSGDKSSKKGMFALVSIVVAALVAAVIALATTRWEPGDQQTASVEVDAPVVTEGSDSTEPQPEVTNGDVDAQGASAEVPGVLPESVPPVAGVTVRPSSPDSVVPSSSRTSSSTSTTTVSASVLSTLPTYQGPEPEPVTGTGPKFRVPSLIGLTRSEAEELLRSLGHTGQVIFSAGSHCFTAVGSYPERTWSVGEISQYAPNMNWQDKDAEILLTAPIKIMLVSGGFNSEGICPTLGEYD